MIDKIARHAGWEANDPLAAEIQEAVSDVFIRRGVPGTVAARGRLRLPYFVVNKVLHVPHRTIYFPDLDDAQNGQVWGENGKVSRTRPPGLHPTIYGVEQGATRHGAVELLVVRQDD